MTFNSEYPVWNHCTCMQVSAPSHLDLNRCDINKVKFNFLSFLHRLTRSWREQRRHNPGNNRRQTEETDWGDNRTNCGVYKQLETCWASHAIIQHVLSLLLPACHMDSRSPFVAPKKSVCCAGFDHWREVLSLYSTRQVRFAVPPSVTVRFWTRGYWPLAPGKRETQGEVWGNEDETQVGKRVKQADSKSDFNGLICTVWVVN